MKYFILTMAMVNILVFSCSFPESYSAIKIRIEITGTTQAHVIINASDYGYKDLPFINELTLIKHYNQYQYIYVQCYSVNPITMNIYRNDALLYSENGNYIEYTINQ